MFGLQLWFFVAVLSAAALFLMTFAIQSARQRNARFSLHVFGKETAQQAHTRAFRAGNLVGAMLHIAHQHIVMGGYTGEHCEGATADEID